MKSRICAFALVLTILVAVAYAPRSAGAHGSAQLGGTPSATVTTTAIPTPLPTPKPKALKVWRKSVKAMAQIKRVHSVGVLTDGFGAKDAIHVSGDCDIDAHKSHLLVQGKDSQGKPINFEAIHIGTKAWIRNGNTDGTFTRWVALPGDAQIILIYFEPLPCLAELGIKKAPPHLKNLGAASIDGFPIWHLRARAKSQGHTVLINIYVDQLTFVWRRFALKQIAPKKKSTVVEDATYSNFNVPVTIKAPVPGSKNFDGTVVLSDEKGLPYRSVSNW